MTVFIITETYGFDDTSEVVAVCDSHASAIQWLIKNKGLSGEYSYWLTSFSQYVSLNAMYGKKHWLQEILTNKWSFFNLDGLDYEIEERKIFSEKPLDN